MKQKCNILLLSLLLLIYFFPIKASAAPRTGTFQKHFVGENADSYRTVVVKKITKKKVTFQIQYARSNPYKLACTEKIVGRRKGNTVKFKYKDSWGVSGKGTMKLSKNYIKIKTTDTKGLGFIGTDGKYFKLKRVSGNKKFVSY